MIGKRVTYKDDRSYDNGVRYDGEIIDKITVSIEKRRTKEATPGHAPLTESDGNHPETKYLVVDVFGFTKTIFPHQIIQIKQ